MSRRPRSAAWREWIRRIPDRSREWDFGSGAVVLILSNGFTATPGEQLRCYWNQVKAATR